jgi:hypothetical protein
MWFAYIETTPDGVKNENINADNWVALSVDRVKEIIQINKNNEKPVDLRDYEDVIPEVKQMDYADVVGQDSLTRMMDKKKKKKKKHGGNRNRPGGNQPTQAGTGGGQPKTQNNSAGRDRTRRQPPPGGGQKPS